MSEQFHELWNLCGVELIRGPCGREQFVEGVGFWIFGDLVRRAGLRALPKFVFAQQTNVTDSFHPRDAFAAQFAAGSPSLVALAGAVQSASSPVQVQIQLMNRGALAATGARILSVSGIRVLTGTGAVTPVNQTADFGSILPGTSATRTISFDWPATAKRIQFTVNFGDVSGYRGSTTMAVFR